MRRWLTPLAIIMCALAIAGCGTSNAGATGDGLATSTSPTATARTTPTSALAQPPASAKTITTAVTTVPTTTTSTTTTSTTTSTAAPARPVRTGSHVLVDSGFAAIDGMQVGLIAHQASLVDGQHLGDLVHAAPNVDLVALFGPEHGVRGDADAGVNVDDGVDPSTGVPVYSLYGSSRSPDSASLDGIDVLLYDLQDVGTRYYTYISTMGLAMQAAADADVAFVVLDRPNPLGGIRTSGDVLVEANTSFVGMYPVPEIYGLTAGQLATALVSGDIISGYEDVDLTVIEMDGWDPTMLWDDTGLAWVAPSPALTTPESSYLYPATVYFEATNMSYGRGTHRPFQVIGAPWLNADRAAATLNALPFDGIEFKATTIRPEMLPGMTIAPAYLGETIPAVSLVVTNPRLFDPSAVAVYLLDTMVEEGTGSGVTVISRPNWLDRLSGTDLLRTQLVNSRRPVNEILSTRQAAVDAFNKRLITDLPYASN